MRRLTFAVMILVLAAPMLAIGFGSLWIKRQRDETREGLRSLLEGRLRDAMRPIETRLEDYQNRLDIALDKIVLGERPDSDASVEPLIADHFYLTTNKRLLHPRTVEPVLSAFLVEEPWTHRAQGPEAPGPSLTSTSKVSNSFDPSELQQGQWTSLFVGPGLQLYYWRVSPEGDILGVTLRRGRWMADLIADLPDTPLPEAIASVQTNPSIREQLRLVDPSGVEVYAWGKLSEGAENLAEVPLPGPLSSWRIQYLADPQLVAPVLGSQGLILPLLSLGFVVLALIALGIFVLFELTRQHRLARQRVSFVGQVSHEFRTPLTNIRLYAELLERDVLDDRVSDKASVIRGEAERLGRLITNVLELSRSGSSQRPLRRISEIPDEVIERALRSFEPSFSAHHVEVHRDLHATSPARLDADVLEQIVVNLLSNVEKYALQGGRIEIHSSQSEDRLVVRIRDHGPGISKRLQRRLFQPFVRGSNAIDAPSGMGIGLSIARELARAHGGDLRLEGVGTGACFVLELKLT